MTEKWEEEALNYLRLNFFFDNHVTAVVIIARDSCSLDDFSSYLYILC